MRPSLRFVTRALLVLLIFAAGAILYSLSTMNESRSGPTHHFTLSPDKAFLTDEHAAAIVREVMKRDGFSEADWQMMLDGRTTAPDFSQDRFLVRGSHGDGGYVMVRISVGPNPLYIVNLSVKEGEITARGTWSK